MASETSQFEDPDLKEAILRVRGGHRARPELVDRVKQALAAATESPGNGSAPASTSAAPLRLVGGAPAHTGSRVWVIGRRLAVAASILVAFGLGMVVQQVRHEAHEREEYLEANQGLFRDMIAVHSGNDAGGGAQPLPTGETLAALRDQASAKLGRFVPMADLAARGWALKEAYVREFHAFPAASFVFTRDGRKITLLSLPAHLYAFARDGESYETVVDGYPIAGFIGRGGVHCVVGDRGTPLSDVTSLTTALQKS
jgi:hypothetical protein